MKKGLLIVLPFVLFFTNSLKSQTIVSIAGGGAMLGDGGLATVAQVSLPAWCEFDASGNFYFFQNLGAPRVRKITPSGIITTVAGNGSEGFSGDGGIATAAQIKPQGITVDAAGNIFIADYYNNRVRKVDVSTGIINTIAGNGTSTSTGDGGPASACTIVPLDLCVDGIGNVFISDNNGFIRKIDAATGIISLVSPTSALGMCFDAHGNLMLGGGTRIFKVDTATGVSDTIAGTGLGFFNGDGIPATTANIRVMDLTIDDTGNLYFADMVNDRVRKIDTFGIITTIAGTGVESLSGDGGPASAATLFNPEGVAFDPCGNLFIADDNNHRIRKVTFNTTPIATIAITATPNDTICTGTPITLTATTTGGSTEGYQWYKNATAIAGATNATYTYTPTESDDDIKCVFTGVDVCSFSGNPSSNVITIVLTPLTIPSISVTAPAAATIGSTVTVSATVANAGSSYSIDWYKNSVLFATTTTPTTTYTKTIGADIITARITSTDATGCYDTTTSAAVTITDAPDGVEELQSIFASLKVYPNPAHNIVSISCKTSVPYTATITNAIGQKLISIQCHKAVTNIDVNMLPAGVYSISINGHFMQKLIKQ